ncbi:apolipoprotein A1/A4/E family protein, partial [Methylobacterium sp. IIF4SW-B5]|nr:apolipoprotein A1/A4/E family protein [Methylobacterium ajmalii]
GSALPGPRDGRRDGGLLPPDRSLVANDDRRSVGALQQTLRVEPSRAPYAVASLAALLWLSGFAALAWAQSGGDLRGLTAGLTGLQGAIGAAAVLAPVMLFYIAAMLAVRAQEMRLVARAVGEVAIRLAEPEGFSTDAVLTMSQAVRREVAAVGDGVERALARAGELETLVRGEISTLERAYSDNEIRIRTLVDELVAQRESIVANAERVRGAIQGSHQNLTQELDTAAERIVTAVDGAGERVTHALGARGEAITAALGERGDAVTVALAAAGERVVEAVAGRGDDLVQRLVSTSEGVKADLDGVGESLSRALESRAVEVTEAFERTGGLLTRTLAENAGEVARTLAETGAGVIEALNREGTQVRETFERSAVSLEERFLARGTDLTERFAETGAGITERFAASGSAIAAHIADRGIALREEIEQAGTGVAAAIGARAAEA